MREEEGAEGGDLLKETLKVALLEVISDPQVQVVDEAKLERRLVSSLTSALRAQRMAEEEERKNETVEKGQAMPSKNDSSGERNRRIATIVPLDRTVSMHHV